MDDREVRIIKEALVCCYENRMKVRSVSGFEEFVFKSKEEIGQKKTSGVYVIKNGVFYSVLRVAGILYFIDDTSIYDIKANMLSFSCCNIDDNYRHFEVKSNNRILTSLKYLRINKFEDNWSTEDDLDMFAWISGIYFKGRLDNILQY